MDTTGARSSARCQCVPGIGHHCIRFQWAPNI